MEKERFVYYTTHVSEMDAEHWEILHILDLMNNAIRHSDLELLKTLSVNINKLLHAHYSTEERYMHSINYPYIKAHAAEHVILKKEMDTIINNISKLYAINCILADWLIKKLDKLLIGHIDDHDLQYSKFVAINK